jgi:hypothetical protein
MSTECGNKAPSIMLVSVLNMHHNCTIRYLICDADQNPTPQKCLNHSNKCI